MSAGSERVNGSVGTEDAVEPAIGRRAFIGGSVAAVATAASAGAAGHAAAQDSAYDGWFEDVDNYEGTVDLRGEDQVSVAVGSGDAGLRFDPPAILVDPGTTVVWEWTGVGGGHNVVHEAGEDADPAFESDTMTEAGETFEYTFDVEEGVFPYYCSPHRGAGMKGAVAVGNVEDELIDPTGGSGGGPLTIVDTVLAGGGVLLALALIFAVVRPGTLEPDRA